MSPEPKRQPPMNDEALSSVGLGVLHYLDQGILCSNSMQNQLLVARISVAGRAANCLFDSGATHNFISENYVKSIGVAVSQLDQDVTITLADGRRQRLRQMHTEALEMSIGGLSWKKSLMVMPLGSYDVILGKPWLTEFNPTIDFRSNVFQVRGVSFLANSVSPCKRTSEPVLSQTVQYLSSRAARKELKKGAQFIVVNLESTEEIDPPLMLIGLKLNIELWLMVSKNTSWRMCSGSILNVSLRLFQRNCPLSET